LSRKAYRIEPLNADHDRTAFACGVEALERYIQHSAGQDMRRSVAVVYVLVETATPQTIAGFYTLSASSVPLEAFPNEVARRLPRYPRIPVALIGRMATDVRYRGQHCGARLLVDALARSCAISEQGMGVAAVVVDAKTEHVAAFYERFGFMRFTDTVPPRLFIPIKTAREAVGDALPGQILQRTDP